MKRTRSQLRAELLAEAEIVIDELLDWNEDISAPTLRQLEDTLLKLRKQLGRRMGEIVLKEQAAGHPVPELACPECGEAMRYKGMKPVSVESQVGELGLERAYYYCDHCRCGFFPLGSTTGGVGDALE